jgi:GT2 family glycosyltransferase
MKPYKNQTIKPDEILLWYNNPGDSDPNYEIGTKIPTAYCTANFGVWARFAFALNAKSEYICIFDDDTIPGKKWLENCLNTMKTHEGLLGTVGLYYPQPLPAQHPQCSYYEYYERYGWVSGNDEIKQVDLVGHSWFFKKEWLSDYWRELPDPKYNICGEDMHFSYMLQKYRGIPTYVPAHPKMILKCGDQQKDQNMEVMLIHYGKQINLQKLEHHLSKQCMIILLNKEEKDGN